MISLLKKLFFPVFFVMFIFSFFLIEGDYKFYLFLAWSIFIFIYKKVFIKNNGFLSATIVLAFFTTLTFAISTLFSQHIPISIEGLSFYLVSLAIFIFFISIPKGNFNQKTFIYYLSIVSLILNFLVLGFTLIEIPYISFPGMNLLVRSYGHNHYVSFLMLTVPMFWWQLMFPEEEKLIGKKEIQILSIILLISSYLIILMSLARFSLLIFLLQLVLVFLISKNYLINLDKSKKIFGAIKILIITLIIILISYLLIPLFRTSENKCLTSIFTRKDICYSLTENIRFSYWRTAIAILKENLIFGSGPKTFNFVSRHFKSEGFQGTSYAHNIFLHNLAEGGFVVGGIFIIFIIYIYYKSLLKVKNSELINKFLLIGAASSFLNSLFDYDWNFFVIFTLTLIYLAITLQIDYGKIENSKNPHKNIYLDGYFLFVLLACAFLASSFFTSDVLSKRGQANLVIKYFPYINSQIAYLSAESKIGEDEFEKLWPLYKNDPNFVLNYLKSNKLNKQKKIQLLMNLADLDHKAFLYYYSTYKPVNDLKYNTKLAKKKIEIINKQDLLSNHKIITYTLDERKRDSFELMLLANELYKKKSYKNAIYFYDNAYKFYPKIYRNKKILFEYDTNVPALTEMLSNLDLKASDFGIYGYDYDMQFVIATYVNWKNNNLEAVIKLTENLPDDYAYYYLIFKNIYDLNETSKGEDKNIKEKNFALYYDTFKTRPEWESINLLRMKKLEK